MLYVLERLDAEGHPQEEQREDEDACDENHKEAHPRERPVHEAQLCLAVCLASWAVQQLWVVAQVFPGVDHHGRRVAGGAVDGNRNGLGPLGRHDECGGETQTYSS